MTPNSKIGKVYAKNFEPNPDEVHNSYERFQKERYGNILNGSDKEPEEQDSMSDILDDYEISAE